MWGFWVCRVFILLQVYGLCLDPASGKGFKTNALFLLKISLNRFKYSDTDRVIFRKLFEKGSLIHILAS